jgi:ATP-dependent DNA helicase RecG
MSATPIPRTLTMSVYGDLDVSVINEMPKNRKQIKTFLRGESKLDNIYDFIKKEISSGNQAFIIYPLVEESDKLELKAAEEYFVKLSSKEFSGYSLGLIHGKMNWRDKENIMFDFAAKKYDVLIATTVIEVGIDIPDATVIVINDAFRFGLSQLHQLRGRVGRSSKQAFCILITKDEYISNRYGKKLEIDYLSKKELEKYKSFIRLKAMTDYSDGFKLSEIDLKLRGPGNIFGKEQSGFPELKYADIVEDTKVLITAKEQAFGVIREDPNLLLPKHSLIKSVLRRDYANHIIFSDIA